MTQVLVLPDCPYCKDNNSQQTGPVATPTLLISYDRVLSISCDSCGNDYPLEVQEH